MLLLTIQNFHYGLFTILPVSAMNFAYHPIRIEPLIGAACLAMVILSSATFVNAQSNIDAARDAFSQRSYPWYDAESDAARPISFSPRPSANSLDRAEIPEADLTTRTTGNWNWGGTSLGWGLSGFAWAMLVLLIVGIGALLAWAFFKIESSSRNSSLSNTRNRRSLAESIEQLPFQLQQPSGDFRSLAQQAYQSGDYRRAIVFLFSHTLISLDQAHLIRLRKGKTNRQYLRELKPHAALGSFYESVMEPFESVFFGDHELTQTEFESCWRNLETFQQNVTRLNATELNSSLVVVDGASA